MDEEIMFVTWNTHHNSMVLGFDSFLKKESLVDCTLAAEGKYIKAHKVIVSACSSYLETLLSVASDTHPIIILNGIRFCELESIIEYMYTGAVAVSKARMEQFVEAAEALGVRSLVGSEINIENSTNQEVTNEKKKSSTGSREGKFGGRKKKVKQVGFSSKGTILDKGKKILFQEEKEREDREIISSHSEENWDLSLQKNTSSLEDDLSFKKRNSFLGDDDEEEEKMTVIVVPYKEGEGGREEDDWEWWEKVGEGEEFPNSSQSLPQNLLPCEICGESFNTKGELNCHKLDTHTEAVISSIPPLSSNNGGGIKVLESDEGGEEIELGSTRVYRCKLCPRSFTRMGSLNYHVSRKHSGAAANSLRDPLIYPFQCQSCDNRYKSSTQLSRHKRWECGKEPSFQCHRCLKRFHHRHGLKQHSRRHESAAVGEANSRSNSFRFYCERCGRGYKLRSSLNNHARWECGKEPIFRCTICFVRFNYKGNLKKHILAKHIHPSPASLTETDFRKKSQSHVYKHLDYKHID